VSYRHLHPLDFADAVGADARERTVPTPEAPPFVIEPADVDHTVDPDLDGVEADSLVEEVSIDGMCGVY